MLAHYLPQSYLRRFTSGKRLHVFDRVTGKLRPDSPKNVAAINNYYVLTAPTGEQDDRIEHGLLADIETAAGPALELLALCQPISDEQHDIVATFLAFLCTRVPAFEASYAEMNNQLGQEVFRRAAGTPERAAAFLARRRKSFPYSPEEFSAFVNSDDLTFPPDQHERIRLMIELARPLIVGFKSMDWWLWRAQGTRRFVTSDAPFGLIPLEGALGTYGELSPRVLRFVAISSEVCLMLADRQRDVPFLTVKDLDDDGVLETNAAIALAATRLVVARDRADLELVLNYTRLRESSFIPRMAVVNWDDVVEERSFGLSVRVHHDTTFPLHLPLEWTCRNCGVNSIESFAVLSDLVPQNPAAYSEWLDRRCSNCGRTPRRTKSWLAGEEPIHLELPEDE